MRYTGDQSLNLRSLFLVGDVQAEGESVHP